MPRLRRRLAAVAAAAAAATPASFDETARSLYRALVRTARTFEGSSPAADASRALLHNVPLAGGGAAGRARLFGGAAKYTPGRSSGGVLGAVRAAFRDRTSTPPDLDAGFAALRYLGSVQAAANMTGPAPPSPLPPPATATATATPTASLARTAGPGTVLVAHPLQRDAAFARTVVLLWDGVPEPRHGRRRRRGSRLPGAAAAPPLPALTPAPPAPRGLVLGRRLPATAEALATAAAARPRPGRLHPFEHRVLGLVRSGARGEGGGGGSGPPGSLSFAATGLPGRAEGGRAAPRVSVRLARVSPSDLGGGTGSCGGVGVSIGDSGAWSEGDEAGMEGGEGDHRPLALVISVSPGDDEDGESDEEAGAGEESEEEEGGGASVLPLAALEARLAGWLAEESGRAVAGGGGGQGHDLAAAWGALGSAPLWWGGPVPATTLVHGDVAAAASAGRSRPTPPEHAGAVALADGALRFFNTGALAAAAAAAAAGGEPPVSPVLPFVGCTAWAPGQLERELRAGDWLAVAAGDDVLRTLAGGDGGQGGGAEAVWRRALVALGPPYAAWAGLTRGQVAAAAAAAERAVADAAASLDVRFRLD